MNRFKAEEARARQEARAGKTEVEIAALDREDALKASITELARKIHIDRFPEEYDHYYDSIEDVKDRKREINPMNKEYIAKVNAKREELGVEPLAENGMPTSNETWEIAYSDAEHRLRG
tara:strand:- start:2284 stop:2640 length:357 start_codon:yes stop_codon:yes gene_type:complete